MTAIPSVPSIQASLLSWVARKTRPSKSTATWVDDDLRREYVSRIIASEGCTGEYGVQALMGLFPKDF